MREYSQFGRVFGPLIYMYIGGILLMTFVGCMIQIQIKDTHPSSSSKNEDSVKKSEPIQENIEKSENKVEENKEQNNEENEKK